MTTMGHTRTFNYVMTWSHLITDVEDPTGQFPGFNAFWRLEGVITTSSTAAITNDPPIISSTTAAQDGLDPTRIIVETGGPVTVTVDASDPDGDALSYDWTSSDQAIIDRVIGDATSEMLVFDPSGLEEGFYSLKVVVTDDATAPQSARSEIIVQLLIDPPPLGPEDSDGDGISDEDEGFGDSDDDALPEYLDPVDGNVEPTRNRRDYSDQAAGDIVSNSGRLVLGNTAFSLGNSVFVVPEDDIALDRVNLVEGIQHSGGGILDFQVAGLAVGATVQVVLPQAVSLPNVPIYRKYTDSNGWFPFSATSGNALASASRVAGVCPDPGDAAYDSPVDGNGNTMLVEGDDCIRLTIVDGGSMDGDGARNGVVLDPGTAASDGPVPVGGHVDGIFSGGGGCVLNNTVRKPADAGAWWLIIGLLAGLRVWCCSRRHN